MPPSLISQGKASSAAAGIHLPRPFLCLLWDQIPGTCGGLCCRTETLSLGLQRRVCNLAVQKISSHLFYFPYTSYKSFKHNKIHECSNSAQARSVLPELPLLLVTVSVLTETWLFSPEPKIGGFVKEEELRNEK